jgi:hypothetical protein
MSKKQVKNLKRSLKASKHNYREEREMFIGLLK